MTTLKVTIDNRKHALLLTKLLKSMAFVKKVEEDFSIPQMTDQFVTLKNIFNAIEPNNLFANISNPIEWQKNIRNEWEAR